MLREEVMVFLQKGWFLVNTFSKLPSKKYKPCQIMKKINDNACVVGY